MAGIGHYAVEFLKAHPGQRYTARGIVVEVLQSHKADFSAKRAALAKSRPELQFEQQLVAELAQRPALQKRMPNLMTDESVRPKLFYWADKGDLPPELIVGAKNSTGSVDDPMAHAEHALYEPIRRFLHTEYDMLSVRVDEKTSKNNRGPRGNQWLHPDIVGMLPKGVHWQTEDLQCAQSFGSEVIELWSFEVKVEITASNLRECFFQAVSNSSWATYGYLVAASVSGKETWDELEMLCAAHGIGFMRFQPDCPAESRVAIPGRKRSQIDWNTVDRIASQNRDFQEYARRVSAYLRSSYLDTKSWGL
nr:hypothetical protein [uncultured Rhodopila sp.]